MTREEFKEKIVEQNQTGIHDVNTLSVSFT